jgi:hypothetical protein
MMECKYCGATTQSDFIDVCNDCEDLLEPIRNTYQIALGDLKADYHTEKKEIKELRDQDLANMEIELRETREAE